MIRDSRFVIRRLLAVWRTRGTLADDPCTCVDCLDIADQFAGIAGSNPDLADAGRDLAALDLYLAPEEHR